MPVKWPTGSELLFYGNEAETAEQLFRIVRSISVVIRQTGALMLQYRPVVYAQVHNTCPERAFP
jgi:hypothetical protein